MRIESGLREKNQTKMGQTRLEWNKKSEQKRLSQKLNEKKKRMRCKQIYGELIRRIEDRNDINWIGMNQDQKNWG